jgi:ribose transport system ATP-binding protein
VAPQIGDAPPAALAVEGLSKTFGGQRALADLDLEVGRGEVHALLGQNGSGKSTLIKILSGFHQPDPGAVATVAGRPLRLGSAEEAHRAGIRFIHQDLALIDERSVLDNLALGGSYRGRLWISDRAEGRAATAFLGDHGLEVDASRMLGGLSPAHKAMVAILRALRDGLGEGGLLVLDEPTVSLGTSEVELLFGLIDELRGRGATVVYVTHRLGEVFRIADRVSVLRDGRRVATEQVSGLDHARLAELIVGRPLDSFYPELPVPRSEVVLSVRGLRSGHVRDVSLDLHRSEVLGLTGLVGSGYDEILPAVFGSAPTEAGEVRVAAGRVSPPTPAAAIAAGIAFAPADRKRLAAIMPWTLRENVTLPALRPRGPARWLGARREAAEAAPWLERLEVVPADPEAPFESLSGGNQQRVVLARWLRCGADVFLLDEPTNGVDVGAKHALYESLAEAAAAGAGLLIASGDPEELCAVCDRILVVREGVVVAELGDTATPERILAASLDTHPDHPEVKPSA